MSEALDRLAHAHGILPGYVGETGQYRRVSEQARRGVLAALGVAVATSEEIAASLAAAPKPEQPVLAAPADVRCFVPAWLEEGRAWGIGCQLYGLRSARNWGIGDFEDLACLAELAGRCGADFIGVNPLHALFASDPARCSPYAPSSRRFLNPLYIAPDTLGVTAGNAQAGLQALRDSRFVDYRAVARLKLAALSSCFSEFQRQDLRRASTRALAFDRFCQDRGEPLRAFALFEALSSAHDAPGRSGWRCWAQDYHARDSAAVSQFERDHAETVRFHMWLQWIADGQLADAQARARASGMRIGLYLDLAVGVAPDGADTWTDPAAVVSGARIGAPPDAFSAQGQDWGLAPLSPLVLRRRDGAPFRAVLDDLMRHAGAVRIDHAMGLFRLFWLPDACSATDGAYVAYPLQDLLRHVSDLSRRHATLVVGEDLGTVPTGFREVMRDVEIQGYRVFYFERAADRMFKPPEAYPREVLACVATHDLPTLHGWWLGDDIDQRERLGMYDAPAAAFQREQRAQDKRSLLTMLAGSGLLQEGSRSTQTGTWDRSRELPAAVCVAAHTLLARSPARLFAAQLEELTGVVEQANLPGTVDQYPNWRRKSKAAIEQLEALPQFRAVTAALSAERPRAG